MWDWRHKKIGGEEIGLGTADVKSYDDALAHPGVAYCLKREFDETGNERERYDHLSKGLVKLIKIGHVTSRKVEPKNIEVIDLF
jgi:hypothetical protein